MIFNKGDPIDGIYFVIEGEVQVILRSSYKKEYVLEKLFSRCTFGYHTMLQYDENAGYPKCPYRVMSTGDTVLLKLPIGILNKKRAKSKVLN